MKINRDLILQNDTHLYLKKGGANLMLRVVWNYLKDADENGKVTITFSEIKNSFSYVIRHKQANVIFDSIVNETFNYNGKEYKYIERYEDNGITYNFYIPKETIEVVLGGDTVEYDIKTVKKINHCRSSINIYEYILTGDTLISEDKFYDFFNDEGYERAALKRMFKRAINDINKNLNLDIKFQDTRVGFIIEQ